MSEALQAIVKKELEPLGLELFELRETGSKGRPLLDIRIERKDGEKITVDDCARASRAIEAKLDEANVVGSRYILEVSSPGPERPLTKPDHFRRYVGRRAKVRTREERGGHKSFTGELVGASDDAVTVAADTGVVSIPYADIKRSNLLEG